MTKRPRNIANDILDCGRDRDREMDEAEEIRGADARQRPLSRLAHDEGAEHKPERGRVGSDGGGLHGGRGRRHAARQRAADLLPGAAPDHGADRRQGAASTTISARPCCPITSRSTASTGTSSMTRAAISRSRTPTGASAAARSRSRNYLDAAKDPEIRRCRFCRRERRRRRAQRRLRGRPVLREGRLRPAVQIGRPRQPLRPDDHLAKGVSVTAARRLIDEVCGEHDLPLFVLHDFDVAGFLILGTLSATPGATRSENTIEVVDLGLRLADIEGLEQEPAAASKISTSESCASSSPRTAPPTRKSTSW